MKTLEPFSAGYFLLHADIEPYTGDKVAAPHDFTEFMMQHVEAPLIKLDNEHYWVHPQRGVPSKTLAVPKASYDDSIQKALLTRNEQVADMLLDSEIEPPGDVQ